jgi:hypothetical protein
MKWADSAKYWSTAAFAYNGYNFVNSDTCTAKFANGGSMYTIKPTKPNPHNNDDDEGDDNDGGHNGTYDDGDDDSDDFAYVLALASLAIFV